MPVTLNNVNRAWLQDVEFAREMMMTSGEVTSTWVLRRRDGATMAMATSFETPEGKANLVTMVRNFARAYDVVAVSFMAVTIRTPLLEEKDEETSPEMLLLTMHAMTEDAGEARLISLQEVETDDDGTVTGIGRFTPHSINKGEGISFNVLPTGPKSPNERLIRKSLRTAFEKEGRGWPPDAANNPGTTGDRSPWRSLQ